MPLAAGKRPRIAAQEWKMRREILTKGHVRYDSFSNCGPCDCLPCALQARPWSRACSTNTIKKAGPTAALMGVEQINQFFVSTPTRSA
jgi:hypothetical protein